MASQIHGGQVSNPRGGRARGTREDALRPEPGDRPGGTAAARPSQPRHAAQARLRGQRRAGHRVRRRRRRLPPAHLLERVGHVDGQRRDGRPFGRCRRRARAPDARQPPADVPPGHRARDDRADPARHLRGRASLRRARSPPWRRPVRRRGGRQPHASRPPRAAPRTCSRGDGARGARSRDPAAIPRGRRARPARRSRGCTASVPTRCLFPQQNPEGIDAGAFHTDVLAVGTGRSS